MAATILAKDVLYRVSAQLLDVPNAADQFERWSEKELVAWLNDGQQVIAKYLPASCVRIDAIKLAAGTKQSVDTIAQASIVPGDGSAPAAVRSKGLIEVIRNMGTDGATPGRAITVTKRDVLDAFAPDWHTETGSAVEQYVFDPRMPKIFYVYPGVPDDTSVWVEISHLANPAMIAYAAGSMGIDGASTTTISIDDQFVDDLVNYILARGHMKEAESAGNAAIAQAHVNMFVGSINAQAKAMTGVNPNLRMLPMAPEVPGAAS